MSVHEPRLFAEENEDNPDEIVDVWMDGEILMSFSYDELGSHALRRIKQLVEAIAQQM